MTRESQWSGDAAHHHLIDLDLSINLGVGTLSIDAP
jgi:hypothetical protein